MVSYSGTETKISPSQISFLDLPGEIRNEIYNYAVESFKTADNHHPHLNDTYTIDLQSIREASSRSTPQWIHNWYTLRSLSHQIRVEADSFVSAVVLPRVIVKSGLHDVRNNLAEIPEAFHSSIQRVAIHDHGFLLVDWSASLFACFNEPLKPINVQKNGQTSQQIPITSSSYYADDICHIPVGRSKASLMLRRYTDTAYHLIELPQLKQVALTFGHWNDGLRISEDTAKKAAFVGALSRFVTLLTCRHGRGPSIDSLTVFCQDTDLQMEDFEQGLRRKDDDVVDLPFRIEVRLNGEDTVRTLLT